MTPEALWTEYARKKHVENVYHEAWAFGGAPDELAELVVRGIKRGTSSLDYWYTEMGERRPEVGDHGVILNSKGEAVGIIETISVTVQPYDQVSAAQAGMEGEGDGSLEHWRKCHKAFFGQELEQAGKAFSEDMDVVFEEFRLVYLPEES